MGFHNAALSDLTRQAFDDPHLGAGRRLLEAGHISSLQFFYTRQRLRIWDASFCDILIANDWVTEEQALRALAAELRTEVVDLAQAPPDPRLSNCLRPEICLKFAVVPWIETPGRLVLATSRPEIFERLRPHLPPHCRLPQMVLAPERQIHEAVARIHGSELTRNCETRVAHALSCRGWAQTLWHRVIWIGTLFSLLFASLRFAPATSIAALVLITLVFLGSVDI